MWVGQYQQPVSLDLTIPGLDHPNVLSYVDVLRQDANVGDRVAIIRAGGIGFDTKRCMED